MDKIPNKFSKRIEKETVIVDEIRNRSCISCGAVFIRPRAGKLFCTAKCKQFSYYHKGKYSIPGKSKRGINKGLIKINLSEFQEYQTSYTQISELNNLKFRKESKYLSFEKVHSDRMKELESLVSEYIKPLKLPKLSVEEWTFIKSLYPNLPSDSLYFIISNLNSYFFSSLKVFPNENKHPQVNPIQIQFNFHLKKLLEKEIVIK